MLTSRGWTPIAGGVLALVAGLGCHRMQPVAINQLTAATTVERVWITRRDQVTLILDRPRVNGDTLTGFVLGEYREMPVADVATIQERHAARGRTWALVAGSVVVLVAGVTYMGNRQDVGNAQTCYGGLPEDPPIPCCPSNPSSTQRC